MVEKTIERNYSQFGNSEKKFKSIKNMLNLVFIAIFIVLLVYSIILHEYAHGLVADYLGDPTAKLSGRMTLNPIPHIDPLGSIILPLILILTHAGFLIGWAKPVPIDPYNLRNIRRDSALISLAGPATNLILALMGSLIIRLISLIELPFLNTISNLVLPSFISLNIALAIFNFLPIAPLDGFKIVGGILPEDKAKDWYQLEKYGMLFLLLLLINPGMLNAIVGPVMNFILKLLIPASLNGGGII